MQNQRVRWYFFKLPISLTTSTLSAVVCLTEQLTPSIDAAGYDSLSRYPCIQALQRIPYQIQVIISSMIHINMLLYLSGIVFWIITLASPVSYLDFHYAMTEEGGSSALREGYGSGTGFSGIVSCLWVTGSSQRWGHLFLQLLTISLLVVLLVVGSGSISILWGSRSSICWGSHRWLSTGHSTMQPGTTTKADSRLGRMEVLEWFLVVVVVVMVVVVVVLCWLKQGSVIWKREEWRKILLI